MKKLKFYCSIFIFSQPLRYESSLERKSILSKDNNQGLDKDMILKMRVDNIKRFISSNYRASKPMRFISFESKQMLE